MIIAIDGPAGAGKSTISQRVAAQMDYQLLDTGAIYRSVAWAADREGVDRGAAQALARVAARLEMRFSLVDGVNRVYAGLRQGEQAAALEDVTEQIRTTEMSQGASQVARHQPVRDALLEVQRQIGRATASVVEGRDIGTVVFPEARLKIFLTASPAERARRRRDQLLASAEHPALVPSLEQLEGEIKLRDDRDSQRTAAPLKAAQDAVLLDTTAMTLDQVVERIVQLARARDQAS
jgi:cytidylate kinase